MLDIYRNSIAHFLATPRCLARSLLRGATEKELREDQDGRHDGLRASHSFLRGGRAILSQR